MWLMAQGDFKRTEAGARARQERLTNWTTLTLPLRWKVQRGICRQLRAGGDRKLNRLRMPFVDIKVREILEQLGLDLVPTDDHHPLRKPDRADRACRSGCLPCLSIFV